MALVVGVKISSSPCAVYVISRHVVYLSIQGLDGPVLFREMALRVEKVS